MGGERQEGGRGKHGCLGSSHGDSARLVLTGTLSGHAVVPATLMPRQSSPEVRGMMG